MNEREIFLAARAIEDAERRAEFVARECGDDSVLRSRVEELLSVDRQDDSFLQMQSTQISQSAPEEDLLPDGTMIGPYKLLEKIGEGGFGVVYMAEQTEPIRRLVALKVIKPGMDSKQVIARFEAERQALAIMDHPSIAQVHDAGTTENGRPYFVMELVKGVPITTFCDNHQLTPRQRLELFVPVCQAIQHAHSKGIIHRDIKPGNVLVAMYDDVPVPKVIDFGVAKATGQRLTEQTMHTGFGAVIGSVEYMSPEQASFNQLDVDTRSDVYSLGVLLYELLAGSPPHNREELERAGLLESLRVIRECDPVPLHTRISTAEGLPTLAANRAIEPARLTALLRGELDWIVMKSLEKNRDRRYETVSSLAADVQRFLNGEPVAAHPPGVFYRLRKAISRNRVRFIVRSLLFCLATFLIGFIALATWKYTIRVEAHSDLVSVAIEDSSRDLGVAISAPIGSRAEWATARSSRSKIADLLKASPVDEDTEIRAREFLQAFDEADADRRLAEHIEDVVATSSTHEDVESWLRMEAQFRDLFRARGMDLDATPPMEVARMIREDRSQARLSDALELWIGTLGHLGQMGERELTAETMQPWAEAMYAADTEPVRTGIRRLIYSGRVPAPEEVEAVVEGVDLSTLTPRTLSWLATTFAMSGDIERCNEIYYFAVDVHPSEFSLNSDFAYALVDQRNWREAIRFDMRCTAIRPNVDGIWRRLGNSFRMTGEMEHSLFALQKAVELDPEHAPTLIDLAATQFAMDQFEQSEKSLRQAIKMNAETAKSYLLLGRVLLKLDRISEALVAFEECESRLDEEAPEMKEVRDLVDRCRQELGRKSASDDG